MLIIGFVLQRNEDDMFERLRSALREAVESSSGKTSMWFKNKNEKIWSKNEGKKKKKS